MSFDSYTQAPDAILDYRLDWSAWLGTDTIRAVTWTLDPGITQRSASHTRTDATIILEGGEDGTNYDVNCHITTVTGRQDSRTFTLKVRTR